jgi:hypothetical protein
MRHLDRMAIRMAADAAPGIRGMFALGRHCLHRGSREEARWQQGRMA